MICINCKQKIDPQSDALVHENGDAQHIICGEDMPDAMEAYHALCGTVHALGDYLEPPHSPEETSHYLMSHVVFATAVLRAVLREEIDEEKNGANH